MTINEPGDGHPDCFWDRYGRPVAPGNDVEIAERTGIFGLIIAADRYILLTSPPHLTLHYELPGGGIEKGEGADDALQREIYEETGVSLPVCRPDHQLSQTIGFYAEDTDNFWRYH